jgi:hypothetical protein
MAFETELYFYTLIKCLIFLRSCWIAENKFDVWYFKSQYHNSILSTPSLLFYFCITVNAYFDFVFGMYICYSFNFLFGAAEAPPFRVHYVERNIGNEYSTELWSHCIARHSGYTSTIYMSVHVFNTFFVIYEVSDSRSVAERLACVQRHLAWIWRTD